MYIPPAFAESDRAKLVEFIAQHSFGLLVSRLDGQLFATHLPLLFDAQVAAGGQLLGHMARANPQWQDLSGQQILAVFSGPHAYISPRWYESDHVVPTWNYLAVHVVGTAEVIDNRETTACIIEQYVSTYERPPAAGSAWTIDLSEPFMQNMLTMVVGFRIHIERIEGKWKLGQNHTSERRSNVVQHLSASDDPQSREIARLMDQTMI
ncbi:MAG TPA: FMN-binding negative transcriptional regulator [Pirellulales bacterium]|nr:FMN-binding negative transcriptional regulator [Pirellulales bacterium]